MLEIKKAAIEDEEKIFRLIRELADAVGFAEQAPLIDIGIWSKTLERMLSSPDWVFLLALEDGEALGLVLFYIRPTLTTGMNKAIITEMIVTERARGRGAGKGLIEEAKKRALQRGCSIMAVATDLDNAGATGFYKKMGFTHERMYFEAQL
ncbi:MAG: GNAT family N-acetyltransferase [Actinomycetota bacterium]